MHGNRTLFSYTIPHSDFRRDFPTYVTSCKSLFFIGCCHGYLMCVEEGGELAEGDDQIIKHLA